MFLSRVHSKRAQCQRSGIKGLEEESEERVKVKLKSAMETTSTRQRRDMYKPANEFSLNADVNVP